MSLVTDLVIARFITLYGDPKTDSVPDFIGEYERSLGHFPAEVLRRAANKVIDDQVFKSWPTPGECRKAAEHVSQMMPKPTLTQSELDKQADQWPVASEESKARVRELTVAAVAALRASTPVDESTFRRGLTETSKRMTGEAAE
ncbi:MAG: hypothetical protein WC807_18655 [Hyphomicrobium sp.]|jgi:hypothetical protein